MINYFCKLIIVVSAVFLVSGCANTMKFNNNLTKATSSPNTATIKVSRSSSWLAGAHVFGIQDGTTKIGELGPGGELTWYREPGYVAIITSFGSYTPTHVIIFPVEASKKYELSTHQHLGRRMSSAPDNFSKDIIVYERMEESGDTPLNNSWIEELAKLNAKKSDITVIK